MHVLVTRPVQDAEPLLAKLRERGIDATAEPLLEIEFRSAAKPKLSDVQAILATSANGVRAFVAASARRDLPLFAVGDATAGAAREAGFETVETASGDVDALAERVGAKLDPEAGALLHVAGTQLVGDLGGKLKARGYAYRRAVLYEARAATHLSPGTVRAMRDDALDGVLFFSPRTAEIFVTLARKVRVVRSCGQLTAFCLSAAVAERASDLIWREIAVASTPEQDALLALIGIPSLGPWSEMTQTSEPKSKKTESNEVEAPTPDSADGETPPEDSATSAAVDEAAESPAASDTDETAAEMEAPPANGRGFSRRSVVPAVILWSLLLLAIIGGVVYAARPFWLPYLEAYVQVLQKDPFQDPRMDSLSERLSALEGMAKASQESNDALAEMERQRAELSDHVGGLVARVDTLEQALDSVRKMVEATQLPREAEDARKSLEELSQRIALLEEAGEGVGLQANLENLSAESDRISASVADISTRIEDLEKLEGMASQVSGEARESFLAASRLREALRSAAPFSSELEDLHAAGDDVGLGAIAGELEPYATSGIPTLATLRDRFGDVARDVSYTVHRLEGEGWFAGIVNRISSLVSVRRTEFEDGEDSVDAALVKAEAALAGGDLMTAVRMLEGLEGDAAKVAAKWLDDARARVVAERAMAMLHVLAISLMNPSAK